MSQIILDDQLFDLDVLVPIARWTTVQYLRELRPNEVIKDERVPVILRQTRQPTFVTIDMGFWSSSLCNARYCIVCFPLRNDEQYRIPEMLRNLLRIPQLQSRALRMGKVIQAGHQQVRYWQLGAEGLQMLQWPKSTHK